MARAVRASRWAWISATTARPSESRISTASSIGGGPPRNPGRSRRREWRRPSPRPADQPSKTHLTSRADGASHATGRRAKRHRVAEPRIKPAFVDISAISTMSGSPRAKQGSGAALATRFAPTHGAVKTRHEPRERPPGSRSLHPPARMKTVRAMREPMKFNELGLSDKVLNAVEAAGYDTPTPIQAQAIPHALQAERRARHRPDGNRQDRRLHAADAVPARTGARQGPHAADADPRADARARGPGGGSVRQVRDQSQAQRRAADRRRLRRRPGRPRSTAAPTS